MTKENVTALLALLVAVVWAVVALVTLLTNNTVPLTVITPVMLVVCAFYFGFRKNGTAGGKA